MTTWEASAAKSAKNSHPATSPSPAILSSVPMNLHPDSLVDPNAAASTLGADVTWGVVIVYDDLPSGKRAIGTLAGVTRQLSGTIPLHPSLWRFDLLEDPRWRAEATAEAHPAGLVIISTSGKGDLPAAVRAPGSQQYLPFHPPSVPMIPYSDDANRNKTCNRTRKYS